MLYERSYTTLTSSEEDQYKLFLKKAIIGTHNGTDIRMFSTAQTYSTAVRHYLSLFPNFLLNSSKLSDSEHVNKIVNSFLLILNNSGTGERQILNHIKETRGWDIVGSLFSLYNFGHHGAYLFPEFRLGTEHIVDYLLIGENSDGYSMIFVEFESPSGRVTMQDGKFGDVIRKGLSQVEDWKSWLERNFSQMKETLTKFVGPEANFPLELTQYDRSRCHYCVVAGRRSNYNDRTYELRRRLRLDSGIQLIHYDNLVDLVGRKAGSQTHLT